MAKQTKKPLTQQQHDFVLKFITKKKPKEAQKQEEKLTGEYQNFLRRRDKVLAEIYRFPAEHPRRKELEADLAGVDALQEKDGQANFTKAYEKLEKVKERAQKAAKRLPPLNADKIGQDLQMLARMGQNLATAVGELFTKAQAVCDELPNHRKTSSFATLNEKLDYRDAFEAVEDDLRTKLAALAGDRDAIIQSVASLQLDKREEEIRKQLAFVEGEAPGSTTAVAGRLDQALAAFKYQGRPIDAGLLTAGLVQKEAALDQLLAEWKDLGGQQRDPQPMPEKFKKLQERDKRRIDVAKILLKREGQWDEQQLGRTKEPPKNVDRPYQWESCPEFDDLSDVMPGSDAEVTPNKIRECRDAARKLVKDALTAHANDPDFVFDLSVQTKPTLVAMLESQMGLDAAYRPDDSVVQELDRLTKAGAKVATNVYFKALRAHAADKKDFQNSRDAEGYEKKTRKLIVDMEQRIEQLKADTANAAMVVDLKKLVDLLKADLAALPKERFKLVGEMADEMAQAIARECPNKTSQQTQEFDIPRPQGGTEKFNAPQKITLNGSEYTVQKCLGAGAYGVALSYQDANGKTLVVKSFKATDGEQQAGITRELKMHRHLMTGDDGGDGKGNLLRLDGVVRSPDGGVHMVLEHADGGGMDRLGESLRVLGKGGLLSQEAQNAVNRHLILQAVKGLKYVQGRNMTHHDIKADNYFLTSDGTVKLADFGSSQVSDNPEGEVPREGAEGAMAFAAPEVYDREPIVSGKADTYTLGVMIAKLTSATDSNEKLKLTSVGHVDYSPERNVTALDRMLKAMMDPDPSKRPRLEAVEYSAYLADGGGHDPSQVQEVIKASIAYSLKAGKEVGEIQEKINSLQGAVVAGETWSAVNPDDKLAQAMQGRDAAAAVRAALRDSVNAIAQAVERMENGEDKVQTLRAYAAPALQEARNAERLCQLGNVTDQNLLQQVNDQLAAARVQYDKSVAALREAVAAEQQKIDAVNRRPDVALLLENLKKAQDALLRGPDETKTTPDQNLSPQEAVNRRKEKLQTLIEKYQLPNAYENGLKMVDVAVSGGQFDRADMILTELEKRAGKVDETKKAAARTRNLLERLKAANPAQNEGAENRKRLADAVALANNGDFDKAHELLNEVERFLRERETNDELRQRAPRQDTGPTESVGRGGNA